MQEEGDSIYSKGKKKKKTIGGRKKRFDAQNKKRGRLKGKRSKNVTNRGNRLKPKEKKQKKVQADWVATGEGRPELGRRPEMKKNDTTFFS